MISAYTSFKIEIHYCHIEFHVESKSAGLKVEFPLKMHPNDEKPFIKKMFVLDKMYKVS